MTLGSKGVQTEEEGPRDAPEISRNKTTKKKEERRSGRMRSLRLGKTVPRPRVITQNAIIRRGRRRTREY